MTTHLELGSLIAAIRRRWFTLVALRTIARALGAAAVPILAALAVELTLRPEGGALVLLAAVTTAASAGLAVSIGARMRRRPDDRHVARFVEERASQLPDVGPLDDAVVSAVDVTSGLVSDDRAPFIPLIVDAGVRRLQAIDPRRLVEPRAIRSAALQAALATVVLVVAFVMGAPALKRSIDTARVRFFPGSIAVEVVPGDTRLPAGTPLRIRAIVRGGEDVLARFPPSLVVSAGGEQRTVRMDPDEGAFAFGFESVDRTFTYRVVAGAARSAEYTVTALFPPRVERIDVRYTYPAFTGLKPRDDEDAGDIYAPAGTRVRIRVHTDKALASGELAMAGTPESGLALRPAGDRVYETDLVLEADGSYRVELADTDGLRSDGDTEYFIRLMDDRPPDIRITRPSADQAITPLEEVAIEARADDDYGVARFELVFSVAGGPERAVPFNRITGTDIQKVGSRLLAAEDLKVQPGDVISYYARAWDVGRGKRPSLAQSDIFFLEVTPFSQEFVEAASQAAGAGASGAQLENLIAAQKEIISATWNIERRTGGGVSAVDLKRVAEAQAELRQRLEQMQSQGNRGRGRFRRPFERIAAQPRAPQSAGANDPLAAAIEAMAMAVQQLEASKTKDAIPHEMAALNGLLAAQAEVRKREVSRQSNAGSGGGSNRAGQDLSALFDRELQRQQRTNYENRNRVEQRPDQQETTGSALDRIRDLARRQEDLSRQQRELADAQMTAEERKRQLERLTREQSELREQAEQLSREMSQQGRQAAGQQQAQQGRSGQSEGQQGGGSGMRGVSDAMRDAAGELRKDNAQSAARSAASAAERLRQIEQQMRGSGAGAAERAAGELQMEAQQIAQEQRRIATEAERLDKAQGSTADARRRLADDKDRLAGRVEELERAARQQAKAEGRQAGGQGQKEGMSAAGDVAKALERERVGRRMRESAEAMRSGGGAEGQQQKLGETERQMAQALDRIVESLGGTRSAEAQQMSEQLEQTRQMREGLDRLERQMRDAEARQKAGRGEAGELQRLQDEYRRELQRTREALGRLGQGQPRGGGNSTPEQHEFSQSDPGTEQFKQDRSGWESLRKEVDSAMERLESAVSDRLARKLAEDRLSAGGSDRVPDGYRRQIARYYESLARVKK